MHYTPCPQKTKSNILKCDGKLDGFIVNFAVFQAVKEFQNQFVVRFFFWDTVYMYTG